MSVDPKVADTATNVQEQAANISPENEINWKKFREDRAAERKQMAEANELAKRKHEEAEALKAALEAVVNKPSYSNQRAQEEQTEETEEERIEKIVEAKWQKKQQKEAQDRAQKEAQDLPKTMERTYTDFNQVCSQENIDFMQYHHPEIYRALKNLPDTFDNWSDIYKTMKKLIPNPDSNKDAKKAEKNFMKPQSSSVGGVTATGDHAPQMLTEDKRSANWARMTRVMRGG